MNNDFLLKDLDIDDVTSPVKESFIPKKNVGIAIENSSNCEQSEEKNIDTNIKENEGSQVVSSESLGYEEESVSYSENNNETLKNEKLSTVSNKSVESIVSSNKYDIDLERNIIKNVCDRTTLSKFIKNISVNSCDLVFKKKGEIIKSGRVGTGTTMEFKDSLSKTQIFTIIVKGDVTGTGTVSSLDMRAIYNHIFKNKMLEGVYLEAADINGDGEVDTLDLLSVSKITK